MSYLSLKLTCCSNLNSFGENKNCFIVCVGVLYPCLMTGGIIRYNFESRHYKDDSDKLWLKFFQCGWNLSEQYNGLPSDFRQGPGEWIPVQSKSSIQS